jgi:hypothetical protein
VIISKGDTSPSQETSVCTRETPPPSGNNKKKKKGIKHNFQPDPWDHWFPGPTACPYEALFFSSLQIKSI